MTQVRRASITFDEGPHLAVGYATLRTGDFRLQPVHIHPPLANVLAAAPLLLQNDLPDPREVDGWEIASLSAVTDAIVWQYPHPARLAVAGRTPLLLLGVLLGALVCRWAKDSVGRKADRAVGRKADRAVGRKAGLLALALYALDPNLIAHSALITTDIAAVFFIVATLYALKRVTSCKVQVTSYGWVGILLGLAQLAKVSTLLLIPVVGLIVLVDAVQKLQAARIGNRELETGNRELEVGNPKSKIQNLKSKILLPFAFILLPSAFILWAGYGFQLTPAPGWPFPLPAGTHLLIFQSLYSHYDSGHPTFALGQFSERGWLWYFPLAFVLKTPLPTLLLGLWAAAVSCKFQISRFTFHVSRFTSKIQNLKSKILHPAFLCLWLFPTLYIASSLFSSVNIGYRHLLPLLPFLYIGIGQMLTHKSRIINHESANQRISDPLPSPVYRLPSTVYRFRISRFTFLALLFWLAFGALRALPYPLTFFNELVGGARNGYRYLVDSNLDWGQNLWDLKRWMADNGESRVFYAHYSPARPQVYGIVADFLPPDPRAVSFAPWNPAPGLYAIGATVLQGPYSPDLNTYAWFRTRDPDARLGHALFVYRVPTRSAPAWIVLCNEAGVGAEALPVNLGAAVERVLRLDCAHAQVYPTDAAYVGGAGNPQRQPLSNAPGLYITRAGTFPLAGAREVALRDAAGKATVAVYRVETAPSPRTPISDAAFDGPLDFIGYTFQDDASLWTYWRVREIPGRPLSLMAHLIAPDGTSVVGDGLSFPIEQWRPGDLIVQRHDLGAAAGSLQIGAYWLDTMERWPVRAAGGLMSDSLTLPIAEMPAP